MHFLEQVFNVEFLLRENIHTYIYIYISYIYIYNANCGKF